MLSLLAHPEFPSAAVFAITVDAERRSGGFLALRFRIDGDLDGVAWPQFDGPVERADELWRHTCFEAFVGSVDGAGYCEFNFAAMRWAAYRFDSYREGMRDLKDVENRGMWASDAGRAERQFLARDLDNALEWRLGLSAVIEATDGTKSYWALAHAPGPPDFHNPVTWTARLPAIV